MAAHGSQTLYELLEVSSGATFEEIEQSYQRIAAYLGAESLAVYSILDSDDAHSARAQLDEAYRTLSDPDRRAAYDRARKEDGNYPSMMVPASTGGTTSTANVHPRGRMSEEEHDKRLPVAGRSQARQPIRGPGARTGRMPLYGRDVGRSAKTTDLTGVERKKKPLYGRSVGRTDDEPRATDPKNRYGLDIEQRREPRYGRIEIERQRPARDEEPPRREGRPAREEELGGSGREEEARRQAHADEPRRAVREEESRRYAQEGESRRQAYEEYEEDEPRRQPHEEEPRRSAREEAAPPRRQSRADAEQRYDAPLPPIARSVLDEELDYVDEEDIDEVEVHAAPPVVARAEPPRYEPPPIRQEMAVREPPPRMEPLPRAGRDREERPELVKTVSDVVEPRKRPTIPPSAHLSASAKSKKRVLSPSIALELTGEVEYGGSLLRRLRESTGASLDEVAEITKVGKRHLIAIETNDFAALPAAVYTRGFVAEYARVLGLDAVKVTKSFMALYAKYRGVGG